MEMKELLENKGFSEDKTCIVNGSALCSCGPKAWASGGVVEVEAIKELMDMMDHTILTPENEMGQEEGQSFTIMWSGIFWEIVMDDPTIEVTEDGEEKS